MCCFLVATMILCHFSSTPCLQECNKSNNIFHDAASCDFQQKFIEENYKIDFSFNSYTCKLWWNDRKLTFITLLEQMWNVQTFKDRLLSFLYHYYSCASDTTAYVTLPHIMQLYTFTSRLIDNSGQSDGQSNGEEDVDASQSTHHYFYHPRQLQPTQPNTYQPPANSERSGMASLAAANILHINCFEKLMRICVKVYYA